MKFKKMNPKKVIIWGMLLIVITTSLGGCMGKQIDTKPGQTNTAQYSKMVIDQHKAYQTIESFGASGAWWSQEVGGWDQPYKDGEGPVREEIAELLFDPEKGIGLTNYRYNIGAGSTSGNGQISDPNRRAQSFETAPFEYDWNRDANAVWFLNKAVELGVEEVVMFTNSPLERLTISGMAHAKEEGISNLAPENYEDFARYVLDVAEHFISEEIPIKFISPINEPQWGWAGGQEGAPYQTKEIVEILKVFVTELEKRPLLKDVEISGPESGEWGGKTKEYVAAILRDQQLQEHFKTIDNHSYWTDESTKRDFKNWMNVNYPDVKLRTSEWCEMVNGMDFTMDSAFNLAEEVFDDLTILDVVSWQLWIAVSEYDYRDGLIYIDTEKKAYRPAKRLWAYGNFTKFVKPGYQRIDIRHNYKDLYDLKTVAFTGEDELVVVVINRGEERTFQLELEDKQFTHMSVYTTTEEKDLECTSNEVYTEETVVRLEQASISTVVLSKKTDK